ncbi:MAG: GTP cyclohydrolase II [Saprospiraceae bacterium]|nr:GTP cyclohydrolase II [Candidatus Brachybacter algidus]
MKLQSQALLPTSYGDFIISTFSDSYEDPIPLVVLSKEVFEEQIPYVRLHSECLTGEVFGSKKCDCGSQLQRALEMISKKGGHLLYLRQEGRGIGLINKIKAYALQDKGMNTLEANLHLGFKGDEREYSSAVAVLSLLNITKVNLITNNPLKLDYLTNAGIDIVKRIPLIIPALPQNKDYLESERTESDWAKAYWKLSWNVRRTELKTSAS